MRFPIGLGVLLVLILGLVCVSPSRSYENKDAQAEDQPTNEIKEDNLSVPETSNDEPASVTTKRGMGMPAVTSSRKVSTVPDQVTDNSQPSPQSQLDLPVYQPVADPTMFTSPTQSSKAEPPQESSQERSTQARGLGIVKEPGAPVNDINSNPNQQIDSTQLPQQIRSEDLPTIIENNRAVVPQAANNQSTQMSTSSSTLNSTVPMSSARTLDSWTNCVGASSNKYGTCKNDVECNKSKGKADGSCMGGFGVCCVVALSCGEKSIENNTFFANPDFPEPSWEARLCEVELKKKNNKIVQIMIEFEEFELAPPNHEGECITDVFQVKLTSNKPSPYSLLRICGQNTGQHMYLDVSQIDESVLLSFATSGGGFPRRWSIRIVQMDEKNSLLAPPGCLQYYTDTVGHFRSFNLGRNLKNLYYAICFRIDNGYSGIRFTENFFGMNGPSCRKRIGGRFNGTILSAHPHHLVIPPPGYAQPYPKPKYPPRILVDAPAGLLPPPLPPPQQLPSANYAPEYQPAYPAHPNQAAPSVTPRYKRQIHYEPTERYQRTLHEHEKDLKVEEKEAHKFHHESYPASIPSYEQSYGPQPSPQQGYAPPPPMQGYQPSPPTQGYSPPSPTQGYPPPPPPPAYGSEPPKHHEEGKHHEHDLAHHKNHGHHEHHAHYEHLKHFEHHDQHKDKADDSFGWRGKQELFYDEKFGPQHHQSYAPQTYGPPKSYGLPSHGPPAYGPPAYGPPTYGPQGYGPQPYKHQGYGEYHHKEIDKFGKQFEHLEHKQEHNHHGKKEELEKTSSSWWPSWGSSKEDKKEKFFQHHEALFPMIRVPEMPHCEPRFCGSNDVITFPPSGDSISEMCGNRFNRGRGPKIISGSPLVVYVSNRGHSRGGGFDMNYEQVFYIPKPY